ncbi:hypothetical protein XA68_15573 [Ophiocordyceps unilateralis]|uniref:FAD-binding PCMH-type domain-containing protein n=1 Tax=Ophiocordyceps unilateralis TaxID=268505 RepID=A0A2A9P895_OPHUN|nr:hypothetical protein XA68_15573 [Ophiocordyceps unilateralis]
MLTQIAFLASCLAAVTVVGSQDRAQAVSRGGGYESTARPWELACLNLGAILSAVTFFPWSRGYSAMSDQNWSGTARAKPACIVRPENATQLQTVVRLLRHKRVPFAVRSGGHNPAPGAASIDKGVLVDLGRLDDVVYAPGSRTVTVGAGNKWTKVYTLLHEHELTVVGGRILDVGVGGLLLGSKSLSLSTRRSVLDVESAWPRLRQRRRTRGGLAPVLDDAFSPDENQGAGGASDSAALQVVLGNGTLVRANARDNADLHWALKGGGNNFGILASPLFLCGRRRLADRLYPLSQLPALYAALAEYQAAAKPDAHANVMLQAFPMNTTLGAVLTMVYLKPEVRPAVFAPFYRIPFTVDAIKIRTYLDLLANTHIPNLPRYDWHASTFRPDGRLYASIQNMTSSPTNLDPLARLTSGTLAVGLQPMSRSGVLAGRSRGGGNALGLSSEAQTWLVLGGAWYSAAGDSPGHEAIRALGDKIADAAGPELALPYLFMNDASYDQKVIASYGPQNVARLREVQRAYDPDRLFQNLVPGGFKLG